MCRNVASSSPGCPAGALMMDDALGGWLAGSGLVLVWSVGDDLIDSLIDCFLIERVTIAFVERPRSGFPVMPPCPPSFSR